MNIGYHAATAVPFIATGNYWAALGCVAPDLTWIYNEILFRASGYKDWHKWAKECITDNSVIPYRIAHSALIVVPVCLYMQWYSFLLGWCIHIALDLPTHWGKMQQRPLFPFKWRWPFIFRSYKK